MGITFTAHAKLLLFGEHSAVYGAPAVGLGLPWRLSLETGPEADDWVLPGLGPYEQRLRELLAHFQLARKVAALPTLHPCHLTLSSEMPLASGFGSSGALCAALASLFFPAASLEELDHLAWKAEHLFHGTPSGIDTVLALRPGWWALLPGRTPPEARPLRAPRQVLVTGAVTRQSDTKALVGELARRRARGEATVLSGLSRLGEVAREAIAALESEQDALLPGLMGAARGQLISLGLETPLLSRLFDTALSDTGALAAKLSGAGGGGAWVLMYEDETTARLALPHLAAALPASAWTLPPRLVAN